MGFFETEEQEKAKKKRLEKQTLEENNVFEGIECEVILPEKQLKTSSKSGTTKGLATLAFGFLGYAAASGTSQNEENRQVETILQIVDNGIVFKNANMDGSDLRIPYGEIVKMMVPEDKKNNQTVGIITLLQNKIILVIPKGNASTKSILLDYIWEIINEKAYGVENEEPGWGLPSEHKGGKVSYDNSDISKLERISVLYEKGHLNEQEFKRIKNRILEKN